MSSDAVGDLLAVQDLDLAADQLRHRRAHLAERSRLVEINERIASLGHEVAAIQVQLDAVSVRQSSLEAELAATEQRAVSVSNRLYGGQVNASRELSAMAAELDQLKARSSSFEDDILLLMEERDPLEASAARVGASLEALGRDRQEASAALSQAEAELDEELADVVSRREGAAAAVPAQFLETYERLRARLGGIGVARLVGNHCDGCHLTLSAVDLDRIRHRPDGEIFTCEQCSRILVPTR